MARRLVTILTYMIACGAFGAVGAFALVRLPVAWNGAILGIAAGLVSVLSGAAFAVFSKLDGILKDSEAYDAMRVRMTYRYVQALRGRTLLLLVLTVVAALGVGAIALLLPKLTAPSFETKQVLYGIGYSGTGFILLFMLRIAHLYVSLDTFRRDLFAAMVSEDRRAEALRELRPSALSAFDDSPVAMHG